MHITKLKFKYLVLAFVLFLGGNTAFAQVQWASGLEEVSSESGKLSFSGFQALGQPNAVPQGGQSAVAWKPKHNVTDQFIKVTFSNPQITEKVFIVESENPGMISEIILYDSASKELHSTKYTPKLVEGQKFRVFENVVPRTLANVASVGVVVHCPLGLPTTSIDAIGIGLNSDKFVPEIKVFKGKLFKSASEKLGPEINTKYDELNPLITADGKTMFFSRRLDPENVGGILDHEDIYTAEFNKETKSWKKARNIGPPLNNDDPNFVSSVQPDGNTLLLGNVYLPGEVMEAGVSFTHATENGWSTPEKVTFINFKNTNEKVDYYLGNSGKVMIIAAQTAKSAGQRDLYVSFLVAGYTWSQPFHLGYTINTGADEYAPYLASDDRTLFFASSGFPGYGKADIFVTHRLGDSWSEWSTPENLGPEVNTANDDEYFCVTASGNEAYYSSAKGGNNLDIYKIALITKDSITPALSHPVVLLCGNVIDNETHKAINKQARIVYENLANGEELGLARSTPKTGAYAITLPAGVHYGYYAVAEGYLSQSGNIDTRELKTYTELVNDLVMVPDKVGSILTINNLFFDFDKAIIKKESFPELRRVANYLELNRTVKIEIDGHTDYKGTDAYNQKLSQQRAESVRKFLLAMRIDPSRLIAKGFGKTKPATTKTDDASRALNRRVEIKILVK